MSLRPGPRFGFNSGGLVDPAKGRVVAPIDLRDRALSLQANLLSHAEAKVAGEAMFERWEKMIELENMVPLLREDTGWADLARSAWEAVWALRRAGLDKGNGVGEEDRT